MDLKNITVLGSGVMGHGIAQVSATAGYNVVLRDIEQKFLDKKIEKIKIVQKIQLILNWFFLKPKGIKAKNPAKK